MNSKLKEVRFIQAAGKGDMDTVRQFLNDGVDIDCQDKDGWTALLAAVSEQKADIARLLLDRGADPSIRNNAGASVLDFVDRFSLIDLREDVIEGMKLTSSLKNASQSSEQTWVFAISGIILVALFFWCCSGLFKTSESTTNSHSLSQEELRQHRITFTSWSSHLKQWKNNFKTTSTLCSESLALAGLGKKSHYDLYRDLKSIRRTFESLYKAFPNPPFSLPSDALADLHKAQRNFEHAATDMQLACDAICEFLDDPIPSKQNETERWINASVRNYQSAELQILNAKTKLGFK